MVTSQIHRKRFEIVISLGFFLNFSWYHLLVRCVFVEILSHPLIARRAMCSRFIAPLYFEEEGWRKKALEIYIYTAYIQRMCYKLWNIQFKWHKISHTRLWNELCSIWTGAAAGEKTETQGSVTSQLFLKSLWITDFFTLPQFLYLKLSYYTCIRKNIFYILPYSSLKTLDPISSS